MLYDEKILCPSVAMNYCSEGSIDANIVSSNNVYI